MATDWCVPLFSGNEDKGMPRIRGKRVWAREKVKPKPHRHALECCRSIITFSCHHLWHCLPLRLWKHCTGHTGARPSMREGDVRVRQKEYDVWRWEWPGSCQTWRVCLVAWCRVCAGGLRSPGYGGHASAVLVDEVAASVEHPAVMEGHEGVSGCGGCVLPVLTVRIL